MNRKIKIVSKEKYKTKHFLSFNKKKHSILVFFLWFFENVLEIFLAVNLKLLKS